MHFDCVNGFLNSIKEIIWQTEAIYRYPLTVDLPQGVYGFQMEQSVYVAHNLIPKLGRLIDYSSVSKMYTFISFYTHHSNISNVTWSINYTNSELTLPLTAKCNESKQIMVFFTSHYDFAGLGRFY